MRVPVRIWSLAALTMLLASCGKSAVRPAIPPLSAVILSVSADTIGVNATGQFSATALDLSSQAVSGVPFLWTSENAAIFTVNGNGLVTGRGEGQARLFVEAGGQRDTADILVLPAASGWLLQTSNSTRPLNDLYFQVDGRHGCVVGGSGEVLTTSDAGATWDRWNSGTAFNLNAVWFVSDSTGWAVGANGTALKTNTAGRTWSLVSTGSSDNLADVYFATPDTGWAVGSNGVVLTTFNAGVTWLKQYPAGLGLNGVAFAGTRNGWAVGNGGVILGSHDRGLTWFIVQPAVTAQALKGVVRRSEAVAFAAGAAGTLARTITTVDSTAWELRNAGGSNSLEALAFISDLVGWAVGTNGTGIIVTTTNGGTSWTSQTAPAGNTLRGVWFIDSLRGWAVGDNGRILHTGSGGQ